MIFIDPLWPHYLKSQDYSELSSQGVCVSRIPNEDNKDNFAISWGEAATKIRCAILETGFFWDALHLDTVGLYERAAFNFPLGREKVEEYEAPRSFRDLQNLGLMKSKFRQSIEQVSWEGVVVIGQHPGDRSVFKAGSTGDYHSFLDHVCSYYKSKAFIKIHPVVMGNASELQIVRGIAQKHGSEVGHVGLDILKTAESVFVYTSTFAIDAISAGKHVYQYAPGYFWQSGAVQYTSRRMPSNFREVSPQYTQKFLDFLIWKYCFNKMSPMADLAQIIKVFASSKELFPLPPELSYAASLLPL